MLDAPLQMKKVSLYMLDADAQQAAMTLAGMAVMHPFESPQAERELQELPAESYHGVYYDLHSRFGKIVGYLTQPLADAVAVDGIVTLAQLREMDDLLRNLWARISDLEERLRRQHEKMNAIRQLSNSLQKFASLDLDLSRLRRDGRFLQISVGTVPSVNRERLTRALTLAGFMTRSFFTAEGLDHVVVFGSSQQQEDVQDVLDSADFRGLNVPDEFSGSPVELQIGLNHQIDDINQVIDGINLEIAAELAEHRPELQRSHDLLLLAKPYASLASVLHGRGGLVYLQGWIPASRKEQVRQQLQRDLRFPCHVEFSDPAISEFEAVPSLLKKSWLLRPFQGLVKNFGIPGYREVDPSGLFALSYILMFGMMFGDIGHGAIIVCAALMLRRRYPEITIVAVLAGISSVAFGFVYGSLFGYERVIEPLWMSPMQDPVRVLVLAVIWGAGFIIVANLLAIKNFIASGATDQALYSGKGLAGLLFYLAACFAAYRGFGVGGIGWIEYGLMLLPLAIIMWMQWRQAEGALFERLLVVFIEGLEHVISNVSGTLSFLRVAAFSLNHIALATAVFAIAGMMDSFGHWMAVVLGNIFIIVLEGAIVAIQCLRLEYYEGFSRFFSGKGKAFEPLRLET